MIGDTNLVRSYYYSIPLRLERISGKVSEKGRTLGYHVVNT